MPAKVDVARRCADLLAALARVANVRLALRETGISASWAYGRRRRDADFRARWRLALNAGRRAVAREAAVLARDAGAVRPAATAGLRIVGSSGKGTLRREPPKPGAFTQARQAAFLDALRATCNVRAAARATRVAWSVAYAHYDRDAAFRAEWDAAVPQGRVHLEMAMIGAARALFEGANSGGSNPGKDGQGRPPGADMPDGAPVVATEHITGMDAKVALQLLRLHAPHDAAGRKRGRWVKPADADATRREILAKVAALRASRK